MLTFCTAPMEGYQAEIYDGRRRRGRGVNHQFTARCLSAEGRGQESRKRDIPLAETQNSIVHNHEERQYTGFSNLSGGFLRCVQSATASTICWKPLVSGSLEQELTQNDTVVLTTIIPSRPRSVRRTTTRLFFCRSGFQASMDGMNEERPSSTLQDGRLDALFASALENMHRG